MTDMIICKLYHYIQKIIFTNAANLIFDKINEISDLNSFTESMNSILW